MTPQTDPRFNLFFINPQCHSHTLNGTLNGAAGDKSQVAQRPRKPILIENDVRRRIVFDMDGLFSGRSVWYLDLNPVNTDLTGHMSFFDADGDKGLPADVLRLRAARHELSAYLINSAGESRNIARVNLAEFGRGMNANVRRSFDVRVGTDGIQIYVDGVTVLDEVFDPGAFKAGVYYPFGLRSVTTHQKMIIRTSFRTGIILVLMGLILHPTKFVTTSPELLARTCRMLIPEITRIRPSQ